ncbi:MAG: TonB-dependent receptor [Gammaproteobacteria bacterium]|nr:TonB-dependent receptor [Gammaproteobacteria bacterium]
MVRMKTAIRGVTGLLLLPAAVCVAEGPPVLEEILVTATKRSESVQDVPLAVSAISGDQIEARGFLEFSDYLNTLPSVHIEDTGPARNSIKIRGISTGEFGSPPTVATYFGEVPTTHTGQQINGNANPRLVDMERLEVLRGPQGTLFGANALAGAVRLIPAAPNLEEADVEVSGSWSTTAHGDDDNTRFEGMLNVPLIEDRLALRVVGYDYSLSGFVDNEFPGNPQFDLSAIFGLVFIGAPFPPGTIVSPGVPPSTAEDVNQEDTSGGRVSLLWRPTDQLDVRFTYMGQDSRMGSGSPDIDSRIGKYSNSHGIDHFQEQELGDDLSIANLVLDYRFDGFSLISSTSYTERDLGQRRDASTFPVLNFGVYFPWGLNDDQDDEILSQEIRLQSASDGALQWLVGGFYSKHEQSSSQSLIDHACPSCLSYTFFGPGGPLFESAKSFDETQLAFFGEVTYALDDHWEIGAGIRYFETELEFFESQVGLIAESPFPLLDDGDASSDQVNPKFQLSYSPNDSFFGYVQAAQGFRTGVINETVPAGPCGPELAVLGDLSLTEPDTLWNYELGGKWSLGNGRTTVNAAVYRVDWEDIQTTLQLACGFTPIVNAGEATGEGAEVEVTALLTENLRLDLAASFSNTEFESVDPRSGFEKGARVPGSPEAILSVGIQYDYALNASWSGYLRADFNQVGDVLSAAEAGTGASVKLDSYEVINLRAVLGQGRFDVELFVRNATDERGILSSTAPTSVLGLQEFIIRPREMGVRVRFRLR